MAALTFMVPLGFSGAAAAVVGRAIGRGDMAAAKRDAAAAILCAVAFMGCSAAVFTLVPEFLATRYTRDAATLAVAVSLIPIAGVFQVFDGAQAVTSGVLRGTGDTRVPAILHMVAFWGVGVPLGATLGFSSWREDRAPFFPGSPSLQGNLEAQAAATRKAGKIAAAGSFLSGIAGAAKGFSGGGSSLMINS
jgi:MATE family multidrug resistance protein